MNLMEADISLRSSSLGDQLGPYDRTATAVQLFRFSAETFNPHRIHYDKDYAAVEGHPERLVQAHLLGAFLGAACASWAGAGHQLKNLQWSNRSPVYVDQAISIFGNVYSIDRDGDAIFIKLDLRILSIDGSVCVEGQADIII
ncbi:MAG: hypothetical protein KA533_06170 [Sphingobium sp.]|nr:hypothetical protein [Sphingobium sp.]MBP8670582.1 hypothetical protein [Sphingobium sp.]MBP9157621.1 hypothetical protein [Sphingobium sp.]